MTSLAPDSGLLKARSVALSLQVLQAAVATARFAEPVSKMTGQADAVPSAAVKVKLTVKAPLRGPKLVWYHPTPSSSLAVSVILAC